MVTLMSLRLETWWFWISIPGWPTAKRRPALVLTEVRYNRASGLAVVCPLTSQRKPYPFSLPVTIGKVEGAILVDQLKSLDWAGPQRKISFQGRNKDARHGATVCWRAPLGFVGSTQLTDVVQGRILGKGTDRPQ